MLNFVEKIKDPIWGWIPITQIEQEIINSPSFTRIRHVKQMSMAFITFIGANHSRYEHSIGTLYVAYRMGIAISKIRQFFSDEFDIAIQCLRIAAMMHDIGHPPFSHAVEWTFKKNPDLSPFPNYSHDEYTKKIIEEDKSFEEIINRYIDWINKEHYYKGNHFNIDKKDFLITIAALAIGDEDKLLLQENDFLKSLILLVPILNGDLDADKIDYILRDNYHCGFPTGVDFDEVIEAFDLYICNEDPTKNKLLLKRSYISTVETLLFSRLKLIDLIHHEIKNRIANQMLMRTVAKILKDMDEEKRLEIVTKMHENWTDNEMFNFILSNSGEESWGKRLFKEQILTNNITLGLPNLPPITRRNLYLISKYPESLLQVQKDLENIIEKDLHLDLRFISPPPLTLQLAEGIHGKRPFLFDASNIIKGILLDSYSRSNVAVYSDSEKINDVLSIRKEIISSVDKISNEIRISISSENKISCSDLILCVLAGVEEYAKNNLREFPVWVYGLGGFQRFISSLMNNEIKWELVDLKNIERKYDPSFYREVEQLVFCGLIDEREKEITYDVPPIFYNRRLDHKLNSFGSYYYKHLLSSLYGDITQIVFEHLNKVGEPIKKCIECDLKWDKVEKYKEFVEEVKSYSKLIIEGGGCILVT